MGYVTTSTEPRWVATNGRPRKAATLADALRVLGVTAHDVVRFTEDDRRAAEKAAEVRKASDATWLLVGSMIAGSTAPLALCPTCRQGDPEGPPGPPLAFGHDGDCTTR